MAAKVSHEEQLEALTRGSKMFTINGKSVIIRQMTITQLGKVARAAAPIADKLAAIGEDLAVTEIPKLIAEHTEAAMQIAVAACDEEEEWVRDLPVDQFMLLCEAIWEVDHAFFVDRVSPVAKQMATTVFGGGLTLQRVSPKTVSQTLLE